MALTVFPRFICCGATACTWLHVLNTSGAGCAVATFVHPSAWGSVALSTCSCSPPAPLFGWHGLQVNAYMFGSVPLRTYLPDGDIDLSVFCSQEVAQSMRDTWALKLQTVIEQEQAAGNAPYRIGDVTVINAEVGLGCSDVALLPQ
eukprot:GHUV01040147.1.p1 GENE.GHUV01040147.1~~GHUV01040147.1.p1  ORF type:complete len:146 (+),score=29.89 GHUV01040147.1:127-564(+)